MSSVYRLAPVPLFCSVASIGLVWSTPVYVAAPPTHASDEPEITTLLAPVVGAIR